MDLRKNSLQHTKSGVEELQKCLWRSQADHQGSVRDNFGLKISCLSWMRYCKFTKYDLFQSSMKFRYKSKLCLDYEDMEQNTKSKAISHLVKPSF